MTTGVVFIPSTTVSDAMLAATDVAESSYPAYNAATTYALDERIYLASTHRVYQSLQAGNVGKDPTLNPTWWVDVEATNRWKLLDLSSSTQTQIGTTAYYEFNLTDPISCVAALNLTGVSHVRAKVTAAGFGVVYDVTVEITSTINLSTWYEWTFGERIAVTQHVFQNIPAYPNSVLRVEFTSSAGGGIGVLMFGNEKSIGLAARPGARLGIQDFSRKERNAWGDTVLVQRAFAKRVNVSVDIPNSQVDNVYVALAQARATPCLWILHDAIVSMQVFGFYNNFEISIPYPSYSECSLDIEGLT